jgi:heme A synthase
MTAQLLAVSSRPLPIIFWIFGSAMCFVVALACFVAAWRPNANARASRFSTCVFGLNAALLGGGLFGVCFQWQVGDSFVAILAVAFFLLVIALTRDFIRAPDRRKRGNKGDVAK